MNNIAIESLKNIGNLRLGDKLFIDNDNTLVKDNRLLRDVRRNYYKFSRNMLIEPIKMYFNYVLVLYEIPKIYTLDNEIYNYEVILEDCLGGIKIMRDTYENYTPIKNLHDLLYSKYVNVKKNHFVTLKYDDECYFKMKKTLLKKTMHNKCTSTDDFINGVIKQPSLVINIEEIIENVKISHEMKKINPIYYYIFTGISSLKKTII